jgi:lysyl-tRNA synthetase class 2
LLSGNWSLCRKIPNLTKRAGVTKAIRNFFDREGYLEVDTPLLVPVLAPESQITPVAVDGHFLQTSPELCMKRLVAAGYGKIFQISHCWRANERGRQHLPEFTMLEWYRAFSDYLSLMVETARLFRQIASDVNSTDLISFNGMDVDLAGDWEMLTVREAFTRYGGMTMELALADDEFDRIMVERIEPALGTARPTFLYDYPACRSALARIKESDRTVAERFELYIAGIELANGFSELTDPEEQRARFIKEIAVKESSAFTTRLPETFLSELAAMPPTAGIAVGVDRLVMLLTGADSIDEVVAFSPEELL